MNFDESGKDTGLIVNHIPANKATFHLRHIHKATLVTLGIYGALMNP